MSTTTAPNLTAEDMQTLLIAARLGYAWSVEETHRLEGESGAWRVEHLRDRTDRIRDAVRRLEDRLGVPESKRMIQRTRRSPTRPTTEKPCACT
jgi:hypothetical protein